MDKQCCNGYEHSSTFLEKKEKTLPGAYSLLTSAHAIAPISLIHQAVSKSHAIRVQ